MSWQALVDGNPSLAAYGESRFSNRVAYLATTDKDGAPRVHPVSPQLRNNRLFLFMYPTSPKAHDLQRGSDYALHCAVEDNSGGGGEFYVRGTAWQTSSPEDWELVRPGKPDELGHKYILFELDVQQAFSMQYIADSNVIERWKNGSEPTGP
jgi:hypothetical protein